MLGLVVLRFIQHNVPRTHLSVMQDIALNLVTMTVSSVMTDRLCGLSADALALLPPGDRRTKLSPLLAAISVLPPKGHQLPQPGSDIQVTKDEDFPDLPVVGAKKAGEAATANPALVAEHQKAAARMAKTKIKAGSPFQLCLLAERLIFSGMANLSGHRYEVRAVRRAADDGIVFAVWPQISRGPVDRLTLVSSQYGYTGQVTQNRRGRR